jgi:hypothetical protein
MEINEHSDRGRDEGSIQFRKASPSTIGTNTSSESGNHAESELANTTSRSSKTKPTISSGPAFRIVPINPIMEDKKMCPICKAEAYRVVETTFSPSESFVGIPTILIRDGKPLATTGKLWANPYVCSKCGHVDFYTSFIDLTKQIEP